MATPTTAQGWAYLNQQTYANSSTTSPTFTWYTSTTPITQTFVDYSNGGVYVEGLSDAEMIRRLERDGHKVLKKQQHAVMAKLPVWDLKTDITTIDYKTHYGYALPTGSGEYLMPDGSTLHVDQYGNYKVLDQDAKVTYKANRIREFSRHINASDLLEEFIKFVRGEGVTQVEVLDLPINTFIHWLIWQAALRDGDSTHDLTPPNRLLPKPGVVCFMRASTKGELNGNYRHGATVGRKFSGTYRSWQSMRARCLDSTYYQFHLYGGRGIGICEAWMDFNNFRKDMGERPKGMTLERDNPDGNYCPENCRWADSITQAINRRSTIMLTFNGKTQCTEHWARELGINGGTIRQRFHKGLPIERVLQKCS